MHELTIMIDSYSLRLRDRAERVRASTLAEDPSRAVVMRDHAMSYVSPEGASRLDWLLASSRRTTLEEMRARYDDLTSPDLTDELRGVVRCVSSAGCDVFAVDQTRPEQADLRLCTYKVLISGTVPIVWGTDLQRHEGLPRLAATLGRSHPGDPRPEVNPAPHPFP
jgi:hypothetical protein